MPQDSRSSALRHYAFISYSHRDKPWLDWLHKVLETRASSKRLNGQTMVAGVVPRHLAPIFRDRGHANH